MLKKISSAALILSFSAVFMAQSAFAQSTGTTQSPTLSTGTIGTTQQAAQNTASKPRTPLDQDALKKMEDLLCTKGFKAYYGTDKKNICQSRAVAPDIAYTCIWDKKGDAAYEATKQGPCMLDYTEHQGKIVVSKTDYTSNPPLPYGTEAECCFRAAKDPQQP